MNRKSGDVAAIESNVALISSNQTGYDVKQRGLSGTVGTDEACDTALHKSEGAIV
jgi:hypothetical protein